jgi:WhiB family transcriptional regulator, redox-sensing transcriptional regulator
VTIADSRDPAAGADRQHPVPAVGYDRDSWRESAACRHADTELFFPIGKSGLATDEIQQAKAVCAGCPVRKDCLEFALDTSQEYGIWGGYDEDERRPLRRQWRRSRTARLS